jgi:hypothetical protein
MVRFLKASLDTSSINNTNPDIPTELKTHLGWNTSFCNKHDVAIMKIIRNEILTMHREFDIETFFQWKLKFLPPTGSDMA